MKNIVRILAFALIATQANAQQNDELNKLIRESFSYFPEIQELEKSTEINSVRVDVARSNYLPSVSANASYNYVDPVGQASFPTGPDQTRTIQFQPHNNYNAYVGLNQVIWDFGRTQAQIDKAKADLQVNQYAAESAKLQLATQVAGIYYSLIYLRRSMEVQDSIIAFYDQNKKVVEGKIREGDALQIDLSNVETTIQQERGRKVEFQRQYSRQLALLQYTTGSTLEPSSSSFGFTVSENSEGADNNPDILAAQQKLISAEAERHYIQRQQMPSLNLVANAGFRNGYQPDIEETRFNYLAGVTLSVPIFQGNRIRQNIAISRKSYELAEVSKTSVTTAVQKDIRSSLADVHAYQEQVLLSEAQIATAKEALRLSRVRYERGVATYLDLVFASTNLQRALLSKLNYEFQGTLASLEIARLKGNKFWEE